MKRIRNLTIILLSFIVMLCLAVGIVLCFPAQESSARAADAPRANTNFVFKGTDKTFDIDSGWTYGELDSTDLMFTAPEYTVGGDVVSFSLLFNGTVITSEKGEPINNYNNYVNYTMPAGKYTLNVDVSNGGIIDTSIQVANFEVKKRDINVHSNDLLSTTISSLNSAINHKTLRCGKPYKINDYTSLRYYYINDNESLKTANDIFNNKDNLFGSDLANAFYITPEAGTYWDKNRSNYFTAPEIMLANTTLQKTGTGTNWNWAAGWNYPLVSVWAAASSLASNDNIFEPGEFCIGYSVQANGYDCSMPQNTSGAVRESDYYYKLNLYYEFPVPQVSGLKWLGDGVSLKPQIEQKLKDYDSTLYYKYSIVWGTDELFSDAGDNYKLSLTLNNADDAHITNTEAKYCLWVIDDTIDDKEGDKIDIAFSIAPADNEWVVQPSIQSWVKDTVSENHIINAYPRYFDSQTNVKFTVYEWANNARGTERFNFSLPYSEFGGITRFDKQVIVGGETNTLQYFFNKLGVGEYELAIEFSGTNNIKSDGTDFVSQSSCRFSVLKASDNWQGDPSIKSWTWNEYTDEKNLLSAKTVYRQNDYLKVDFMEAAASDTATPKLTLYLKDGKYYVKDGTSYTLAGKADAEDKLNAFSAGDYKVKITAEETGDYYELSTYAYFTVILAENSWSVSPRIAGWTYGGTNTYLSGTPRYAGGGYVYTIDGTSVTTETEFINKLNGLDAGDHTVIITVKGVENQYGDLPATINFKIEQGQYPWKDKDDSAVNYVPKFNIDSLVYDGTASYEIVAPGEATDTYSIIIEYYDALHSVKREDKPVNAGSYSVKVTLTKKNADGAINGNYAPTVQWLDFKIDKAVGNWTNGTAPANGATVSGTYDGIGSIIGAPTVAVSGIYDISYTVTKEGVSSRTATGNNPWICSSIEDVKSVLNINGVGTYKIAFRATANTENRGNYEDFQTEATYVISRAQNSWDANSVYTSVSAIFGQNPALKAFTNAGNVTVTYAVAGTQISETDLSEFNKKIAEQLDANTYTVNVSAQDKNWTTLSERFTLTIGKADSVWSTDHPGQLNNGNDKWNWGTEVGFTAPGTGRTDTLSYALVTDSGSAITISTQTESGVREVLKGLDADTYILTVTALETTNYKAVSKDFEFTINPVANAVTALSIAGWTYGSAANTPAGTATHGTPSFTYERKNGNDWVSVSVPSDAGTYRVTATVSETGNYAAATRSAEFAIAKAEAAISGLTIGGFQWNGYDKTTFAQATSNSPAAISYAVYSGTNKLFNITLDANGLPDDAAVTDMNGLVAGAYRLVASTEATTNYNPSSDETSFTVTAASNGWLVTPGIRSWVHYLFDDEVNMPYAAPQYGNITVEIRRESDNELIYSGTMTVTVGSDGEYTYAHTGNTAKLWNAVGGVYVLTVTVSGEQGKYNGLTSTARFDIFTGSTSRPQNYWEEVPSIDSWTSEYQDYTTPAGVPNRWTTVTHEYYEAERTADGFVSGDTVLATITRTYVGAGSPDKFEVDGTMPQKPGWYKVVYTSEYEDGETVYEADALTYTVYFQILEAENSWIETPSIENWLLNGEASVPTTGSAMYDSDYEITYRPFDDPDATPVEEKPTTAGRYVMIVTAKAKVEGKRSLYCKDIVSEVVFTVSLAVNEWITPPVMENWSEEFSDQEHNPVAEAKAGTVTYYYYDSNHELLKEKPTAAGDYFMVAEVEAEGYEKLSAEVKFTITSAWDESLILVDIVLGIAACAATVVAIIFAKRRKSQC